MAIQNDFTINYTAKTVTHTANANVYTVLAFFQWLATEFATTAQMDDDYAFVSDTPTVYRWVNSWDMGDDTSYKYLSGGSVESSDAQKLYTNLYSIGDQFRSSMIYIVQNDAELTPWWGVGNIDIVIKVKSGGTLIDGGNVRAFSRDTDGLYDHNLVDLSGAGRNPVGINTFEDGNYKETGDIYLDVDTVSGFDIGNYVKGVTSLATGRIQYIDVPNTRLYLCQVEGTFATVETINETLTRDGSGTGSTATNHATPEFEGVRGYNNIMFAFVERDFTGGTVLGGPFTVGETVTQTGTAATFYYVGIVGTTLYMEDITGSPNGTGLLTGGSSGATYTPTATSAQTTISKDLNNGAGVQPYRVVVDGAGRTVLQIYQYLKYICAHNATLAINGDEGEEYRSALEGTYTDCKQAPFGTFAGGTFFGARGIWLEDYAVAAFQLIDADGDTQIPPNYKKATVSHASLSGCKILIAERSGANIIKNQYTISSTTANSITMTAAINANKAPQSGICRNGDIQYAYTSFSGAVLSGVTPDPTSATGDCYIPILDVTADATSEESANVILSADFDVKTRVRKYGYKDYTMDTTFPTTGLAVTPILATDPQAS